MKAPMLQSFRLKNFKAVGDSRAVKFTPLTVFIGNNGSGKSSLIEGLQTLQDIVDNGLDSAMQQWRGFEHIRHQGVSHQLRNLDEGRQVQSNPMSFSLRCKAEGDFKSFTTKTEISLGPGGNELFFVNEEVVIKDKWHYTRHDDGKTEAHPLMPNPPDSSELKFYPFSVRSYGGVATVTVSDQLADDESLLADTLDWYISEWQFVSLIPQEMGHPAPQQRTGGTIRLANDGSNIAEYLLSIKKIDPKVFAGIFEALRYVLPYASDIQPTLTSELERTVYLQMTERDFKVPGWLLSTGTLRILALLALLRHPTPPPLIAIEEIENGFDPRTVHFIVEEIRNAVESGKTQVIVTTHSPYLLDLLPLSSIVLVERVNDEPTFYRPTDNKELLEWSKKFSPGKLYTMGKLSRRQSK
jgi:predicted ATPase